ncbi:MAG: hypothetical protein ACXV47_08545 [Halobacteriota archaeon]
MSTYIMLMQWTQPGIDKIKELPQRLERARTTFKTHVVVIARVKYVRSTIYKMAFL